MKSLPVMFLGLGIAFWGFYEMWQIPSVEKGFSHSKWHYIIGGAVFFVGAMINHWEHTRRKE
jgi:hypothetical protein